jgi:Skp family chaperone for outer membrane proteins
MKVVGTVILCVVVAVLLASMQRAQDAGGAPSAPAQKLNVRATRFAYVDSQSLSEKGVNLDKNSAALADLRTFGRGLNVGIIDIGKLQGAVFIGDGSIDLTDAFLGAWKAKPSGSAPLEVPALKVPETAVAFIDTDAFADPQTGITKLVNSFRALEAEFKPRRDEISKLREQLSAGTGDRKRLEGEIKRKQAAGQADLDKRVMELTGPIYQDIGNSLKPFCKQHGVSLLFDAGKMKKTDKLPPFDLTLPADTPDLTAAFVSAYNRGPLE